jgi:hypothetical protein
VRRIPLPEFISIGGIWLSLDLPDLVLVLTDVNCRWSESGSVSMLVAR